MVSAACLSRLTGDPEIDASVPRFPKILPEVTYLMLSAGRVMIIGGLGAPILPAKVKQLSLLDFITRLDGRSSLPSLLDESGTDEVDGDGGKDARHYYLCNLFQAGLLEEGLPYGSALQTGHCAEFQTDQSVELSAFLARCMDQTRLNNHRDAVLAQARKPIIALGLPEELDTALTALGLVLVNDDSETRAQFALINPLSNELDARQLARLELRGIAVIPLRFHDEVVDIGPVLARQGGSSYADYLQTFKLCEQALTASSKPVLLPLAAQFILLLASRTSPIQLNHMLMRIGFVQGVPSVERLPVVRGQAHNVGLHSDSVQRLQRQARISVPPLRYVGTRTHEVHYSPENLAVAGEVPAAAMAKSGLPREWSPNINTARLLAIIERAFGFASVRKSGASRLCPTGGNLGSPECLVLIRRQGVTQLLRYIPVSNCLEALACTPAKDGPDAGSFGGDEVRVLCLGNKEKTTRQYNEFGENLTCIDGGVALAYFRQASRASGACFELDENRCQDPIVRSLLEPRFSHYRLLWSGRISTASLARRLTLPWRTRRQLDRRIATRKAVRQYDCAELSARLVQRLLGAAIPYWQAGRRQQILRQMSAVVLVKTNGAYRSYVIEPETRVPQLRPLPVAEQRDVTGLFIQTSLSDAPVQVFFLTPLIDVLAAHGTDGHDISLSLAGEWLAQLWLVLADHGLVGCPCGAPVESDLLAHLPVGFANRFTLFSFVFGKAASSTQGHDRSIRHNG